MVLHIRDFQKYRGRGDIPRWLYSVYKLSSLYKMHFMRQWQQFLDTIPSFSIAIGMTEGRVPITGLDVHPEHLKPNFSVGINAVTLCRPRGLWMQTVWSCSSSLGHGRSNSLVRQCLSRGWYISTILFKSTLTVFQATWMTSNTTRLFVTLDVAGHVPRRTRLMADGRYAAWVPLTAPTRIARNRRQS